MERGLKAYNYIIKKVEVMNLVWQDDRFDADCVLIIFGENIRNARIKKNLSLAALAEMVNYDRGCLSKLEIGKQNIKFTTSVKLAKVLDVSYPALFSRNYMETNLDFDVEFAGQFQEDDYLLIFIENFKRYTRKLNKMQMQVYFQTGVSESMVSRILNGKNKNPTLKTLYAIGVTVCCDICNLFSRITEEDII